MADNIIELTPKKKKSMAFFFSPSLRLQRSARWDLDSASRQRPWCWPAATFPPPSCRPPAKGWACLRTLPVPWRSWETKGPSMTASKWLSSWAAAPPSPTARWKGQDGWGGRGEGGRGTEWHAQTLYKETQRYTDKQKEKVPTRTL